MTEVGEEGSKERRRKGGKGQIDGEKKGEEWGKESNIYLKMWVRRLLKIRCHLICFLKELLKLELRKCKSLAKPS